MSTAPSPAWHSSTPGVAESNATLSRRQPPVTGPRRSLSVSDCVGALAGSVIGATIGALTGPAGVITGAGLGGTGGVAVFRIFGAHVHGLGHRRERYYASSDSFEDYGPAYRFGHETLSQFRGRRFDEMEPELENLWQSCHEARLLSWDKARNAVRRIWAVWSPE